jgi:hypothetical protein
VFLLKKQLIHSKFSHKGKTNICLCSRYLKWDKNISNDYKVPLKFWFFGRGGEAAKQVDTVTKYVDNICGTPEPKALDEILYDVIYLYFH